MTRKLLTLPRLLISLPPSLLFTTPPFPSQDSLQVNSTAQVDVTVRAAPHLTCYQFERVGYFCIDFDSSKERVRGRRPYACPQHNCELSLASVKFVWHVSHRVLLIFPVGVQQDHWTKRRLGEEHQLISTCVQDIPSQSIVLAPLASSRMTFSA